MGHHCYAVLCQTLFQGAGPSNPLVENLWQLTAAMQKNAVPFIAERFQQVSRTPAIANVYFASIIRAVQIGVFEYLHGVGTNIVEGHMGVLLPDFRPLVTALKRGTFHLSSNWVSLPEEYLEPPRSVGEGSVSTRAPSAVATSAGSVATARTDVSALTTETPRIPVARIANPAPDAEFSSIAVRPGGLRPVFREHHPPSNDAGHEFCVAWWLRSGCFGNCGRRQTHVPFASPGERSRLLTYCRTHFAATASGGSSA